MNADAKTNENAFVLVVLLLVFLLGLHLRLEALDAVIVNNWVLRDFDRAFSIFNGNYFPLAGPEANNGGRLPGPFLYILLAIPLLFHTSYESLFIFAFILNVASLGMLFFVLRKYFDLYFAGLTTALVCINYHHIGSVNFPINPSFIFPLVVLFLWGLLELAFNRNHKAFPGIFVVLCLAIQFHYSMATYFIVPLIVVLVLRIKIPIKTVFITLMAAAICFAPYAVHKYRTFIPTNDGNYVTLTEPDLSSLTEIVKIITVQNTISTLTSSPSLMKGGNRADLMVLTSHLVVSLALYFLLILILWKTKKKKSQDSNKEIILFAFFYFPALLYELFAKSGHYWYSYVFVVPEALIIAAFLTTTHEWIKRRFAKSFLTVVILSLLGFFSYNAYEYLQKATLNLERDISAGTYKNSKLLLGKLMTELNLSPRQFFDQVYFLDFHAASLRRLEFLNFNPDKASGPPNNEEARTNCFFILDPLAIKEQIRNLQYNLFLEDKTIKVLETRDISFVGDGFLKSFRIHEYAPLAHQSCYSNSFNHFVITKSIRDLLIEAKDIDTQLGTMVKFKTLSFEGKYDSNLELVSLEGDYIIHNTLTQAPFRFKLSMKEKGPSYSIRGEIETYYFWASPNFNMHQFDVVIRPNNNSSSISKGSSDPINKEKLNLLSKNTLASKLNHLKNNDYWNYNQKWFRESILTLDGKLLKNKFTIEIIWVMYWNNSLHCCNSNVFNSNYLKLISQQ